MKSRVESRSAPVSPISDAQVHEEQLVKAFVIPAKRNRLLFLLEHQQKKRRKVALNSLNHFRDLDYRFAHRIEPSKQNPADIEQLLRHKGAPTNCYVISDDWDIDGQFMPLKDALVAVVGYGFGTFLSCVPGKLAYFECEGINERYILEKS